MKCLEGEFEELSHTADLSIRVRGVSLADLFVVAARGMFSLMVDPKTIAPRVARPVSVEALDWEMLLVEWLNELLFLYEQEGMLFSRFTVKSLQRTSLSAVVWGVSAEPTRSEIKAATYHGLRIVRERGWWRADVVFDV